MKIDFSDINDINSSYIHQMDLLSTAIYDAESKHELIDLKLKIDIAALDCRGRIIADMAEEFSKKMSELYCITDEEVLKHANTAINQ